MRRALTRGLTAAGFFSIKCHLLGLLAEEFPFFTVEIVHDEYCKTDHNAADRHQAQLQELRRQAWFEQQELKHQTWQAQQELCRAVDAVEQFKNADDIFQWAESKVNTLTGKTILEAYCDSNNLDYVYWVQACNITPNPDGNFEKYHTQ